MLKTLSHAFLFAISLFSVAAQGAATTVTTAAATATTVPILPYTLEGTEVHDLPAPELKRDYQIFVSLPESYHKSEAATRTWPVLFVTDANYAFPLIRSIARRVGDHGAGLQECILVGLSYARGDTPTLSRNRDYTPSDIHQKPHPARLYQDGPYGQAEAYRQYLAKTVLPYVAQHFRADMKRKIFVGHSYGGLFGLHVLLTEPTLFDDYILGSPSLFFDQRLMLAREKSWAAGHKDLPARVFMQVAGYERIRNGPRYNRDDDMVQDVQQLAKQMQSHHYPHLQLKTGIIEEEDHLTVFPSLVTRGLQWALPPGTK
jgi:predicted alpha/beta superfamily hydrolase